MQQIYDLIIKRIEIDVLIKYTRVDYNIVQA